MKRDLSNLFLVGGAAGSVVLPQALVKFHPQFLAAAAPKISATLPYCTGACGSCGGSCIAGACAVLWLGCCAYLNKETQYYE
ncbi:MAG: hypothetical protein Q4E64_02255 [Phascolarctobacterium sp.]|uniref:hypothetical protein n=1 Tax=Phascolarctobacterium sp. TaxID=2049039 RepID=UPI0026DA7876|nr:hypothetical protein [Phascolarctobacterium sp.]MDO4920638.1 hypothetical protein [Phascolarctobacterium sp.]